jgi:hypothetical protein
VKSVPIRFLLEIKREKSRGGFCSRVLAVFCIEHHMFS